jgi:hypothetical protein
VAALLLVAAPLSLAAWAAGTYALRQGARRWMLALAGLVPGAAAAWLLGPALARHGAAVLLGIGWCHRPCAPVCGAPGGRGGHAGAVGRRHRPGGIPAGLVAAAIPPRIPAVPRPEWEARAQRAAQREQQRRHRRAVKRADREGRDPRSNALGVSLGGNADAWRVGDLIVPPPKQLGLAMIMLGAPGVGKSTASERLGYLCGQQRRHLVVIDAKGGHDGLAEGMVAAYLAAGRTRASGCSRRSAWISGGATRRRSSTGWSRCGTGRQRVSIGGRLP